MSDRRRPLRDEPRDAGGFIGNRREMARDSIPGGIGPRDRRVSASSTQPAPRIDPAGGAAGGQARDGRGDVPGAHGGDVPGAHGGAGDPAAGPRPGPPGSGEAR